MNNDGHGKKNVVIISGGTLEEAFLLRKLQEMPDAAVIACEGGAAFCLAHGIRPYLAAGDFDTAGLALAEKLRKAEIPVKVFPAKKDETDTEIALIEALKLEPEQIVLLGATGTRIDHMLANIRLLARYAESKTAIFIEDPCNRISVYTKPFSVKKTEDYPYISFYAFSEEVTGLTLRGFAYPVENGVLKNTDSIGTSNEVEAEEASVSFSSGILLCIRSAD